MQSIRDSHKSDGLLVEQQRPGLRTLVKTVENRVSLAISSGLKTFGVIDASRWQTRVISL